uniref:Uncharacterized protein n=1 Tax=viral metagenome TaxID=1070528 RepID=A0A6M3XW79_9ZZZZ
MVNKTLTVAIKLILTYLAVATVIFGVNADDKIIGGVLMSTIAYIAWKNM